MMHRARWIYPALMCVLIVLYIAVPAARVVAVAAIGVLAAATIIAVTANARPPRWAAWQLIALGILIVAVGEATFNAYATGGASDAYPSSSDILYLFAYPPLAVGMLWLGIPKTPSRDWSAVIETAALSLAGTLLLWTWLVKPTVASMALTGPGKVTEIAGWVGDVVILVAAVRLLIVWRSNLAATLLALGTIALFLGDLRYGFDLLHGVWRAGGQVDAGIITFYALTGGAALAPSMSGVGASRLTNRQFGIAGVISLAIALVVGPTALLVEASPGPVATPVAIAVVMALVGLLVLARLVVALDIHRRSSARDAVLRRATRQLGLAMSSADVITSLDTALAAMADARTTSVRIVTDVPGSATRDLSVDGSTEGTAWPDGVPETADPAQLDTTAIVAPDDEPQRGSTRVERRLRTPAAQPAERSGNGKYEAVLRVPVRVDGDDALVAHVRRAVVYHATPHDLDELEDLLIGIAEVAGVALDRIELSAKVRAGEREQDVLTYRASHDALTGLANAELFRDELRAASRRVIPGQITGVLFIDLDDFKNINDTLGHDAGDAILVSVAQRIRSCLRHDDIGARLGGDEFAVMLRGLADDDAAYVVARRLTEILGIPTKIAGIPVVCRASVGLAMASSPVEYSALLRRADTALYAAKAAGKGMWRMYDPEMANPLRRNSDLRTELERALISDANGEHPDVGLTMHYQPILDIATNRVRGFEALIRWEHPSRGTIRVSEVIALAEHTGLILPLGEWVFARALSDGHKLAAVGDGYVSVNVSVSQLRLTGFMNRFRRQLGAAALDPMHAVVEITESQLVGDDETIWDDLAELRAMGVRVAIDDYGTGYASLAYLRHPVIDIVKLDRRFIVDLAETRNRQLVKAVIELTRDLGLPMIAEGVEDAATRDVLLELGCPMGQGYLYAPAMPLDQALQWRPLPR